MARRRPSFFKNAFSLLKQTAIEWMDDKAPQLGAALAYYTVFSLAPLVLVLLAIIGVLFRDDPAGAWRELHDRQYAVETDRFINPGEDFTPEPEAETPKVRVAAT